MHGLFSYVGFVSIYLFYSSIAFSQQLLPNVKFKQLTINEGLSDNNVFSIIQDKDGFIWLGTADGLNKYDGYKFTIYRHSPSDTSSLGQGNILCVYEDKAGFIWVGAQGSLSRLDKRTGKFKVFPVNPAVPGALNHNIITFITEDNDGTIWISTYGGGLNRYDTKTDKFSAYTHDPKDPNSISGDQVEKVVVDEKGTLWVATFASAAGNLSSFDKSSGKFTRYESDLLNKKGGLSQFLWNMTLDKDGILWIANGSNIHGVSKFDTRKKECVAQYNHVQGNPFSLGHNIVQSIYNDSHNRIWAGTIGGLSVLDKTSGKFTVFENDPNVRNSLSNNNIRCVYEDRQGLIWIGTMGGGVNIYDPCNNSFVVFKSNKAQTKSLPNNEVFCIYEDSNDSIWLGTRAGGLTGFNRATREFNHFKGKIDGSGQKLDIGIVTAIREADNHRLLLGISSDWLVSFDPSSKRFSYPVSEEYTPMPQPSFIFNLLEDSKKNIWVATPSGLCEIDITEKKIRNYKNDPANPNSISENYTFSVYEDMGSNIWVSTLTSGLNVYERTSGKFYCFKNDPLNPNSISNNIINTVYEAPGGITWLGTNGSGLDALVLQRGENQFSAGYKFYHFTVNDGLPNNVISGIIPDNNGNLWLSTNMGLCKFTPPTYLSGTPNQTLSKSDESPVIKNYDAGDGLPGNSFTGAAMHSKNGEFYFGTTEGLLCFYPDSLKGNVHKPPVVFTSFKIFEKEFALDSPLFYKHTIELAYWQNFCSFEFVALDYAQPLKNQFAYMMEGLEEKWNFIGNRRYASYTNLDPGEYIFRVKASNNDGVWNEAGASIRIVITPPFWRTKWFYVLCVLAGIAIIVYYIKWRERKLAEEKRMLELQVVSRTKELQNANTEITRKNEKLESAYGIIEEKNQEILDSINYAKRIQQAILPHKEEIQLALPESFVLYKPKDIVSGDFYFFAKEEDDIFIAAADCTGHGVPGAFMSMIGSEKLQDAVQQSKVPGEILKYINIGIKTTLHQSATSDSTRDGMDIAFCRINFKSGKLLYAGANRPLWLVRKNGIEVEEIKATKCAIGGFTENEQNFETHKMHLQPGDTFYIFTDGYADQFGGEKGKKFTTKKLKQVLLKIQEKTMQEQEIYLHSLMNAWSLNNEQVDDVLFIGVRLG